MYMYMCACVHPFYFNRTVEFTINRDHHFQVPVSVTITDITVVPSCSMFTVSQHSLSTHNTHLQRITKITISVFKMSSYFNTLNHDISTSGDSCCALLNFDDLSLIHVDIK